MKEQNLEILKLIREYQLKRESKVLEKIIQKILTEQLERLEYIKLYQHGNKLLKNLVVLKAPIDVLLELLITEKNFDFLDSLSKRIEENPDKFEFLNAVSYKVRICAVKYVSYEKLIERLFIEEEEKVIKEIFSRLKDYKFSESQVDKLINAAFWEVRAEMVDYVSSKKKLVERLLIEEDEYVCAQIMCFLEEYKLTVSEANKLIDSTYWAVREYAVEYASKKKIIEVLKTEDVLDVISIGLARLENYKITKNEADILVDAHSIEVKSFGIKYASEKKLVEVLLLESFRLSPYYNTEASLVRKIFTRLKDYKFSKDKADKLIDSPSWFVRWHAVQYVSEIKLIERLLVEESSCVVDKILDKLKDYNFSSKEADKLMESTFSKIILCVAKYASKNKLIKRLLVEKDIYVIDEILDKLKDYDFSKQEADKLMEAKSWKVREYAVKYASKNKLIEKLAKEKNEKVVLEIFKIFN